MSQQVEIKELEIKKTTIRIKGVTPLMTHWA